MVSYLLNCQDARPSIVMLNKVQSWRESQLNVYGDEEDWPWAEVGGRSVGREPQRRREGCDQHTEQTPLPGTPRHRNHLSLIRGFLAVCRMSSFLAVPR